MIKLIFTFLIICTLAKVETSPDYDGLSRPTEFLAVTQSYQQLEGFLTQ